MNQGSYLVSTTANYDEKSKVGNKQQLREASLRFSYHNFKLTSGAEIRTHDLFNISLLL